MLENHLVLNAGQTLTQMDFEYSEQLLAAFLPMCLTVIFHGLGMDIVRRYFKRFGKPLLSAPHVMGRARVMTTIVGIMLAAHFSGIVIWAMFYYAADLLPSAKVAMLFSTQCYTTLGANFTLPGRWAGFGGFEAVTGMLMFGWSTAILAAVVQKLHSIDD
jgi:hypothetical protein